MKELVEVFNSDSLKEKQNRISDGYQVVIFKYSPACSLSSFVERSFDEWFKNLPDQTKLVAIKVNVVNSRSLSQEIAREFDIRHESPQAIWLSETGKIKWQASHSGINKEDLTLQLAPS